MMEENGHLQELLARARAVSWERFGKRVTLCLPGMFLVEGKTGRYPAISITGGRCSLGCDHCRGKILEPMYRAENSKELLELCMRLEQEGVLGCLITGGSDRNGRLPWREFLEGVEKVKARTGLHVSVHSGMLDLDTARALKEAGVDQALVEVVGARETWASVMHLEKGPELLEETLEALYGCGLNVAPHIVAGIHGGRILGERNAMEILRQYPVELLVWVAFMPLKGTPFAQAVPASPQEVARLMAESRLLFPEAFMSLGCARPRGRKRLELERLALKAGVQRIALYSEETVRAAKELGLEVDYQPSCCSVPLGSTRHGAERDRNAEP